MGRVINLLNSPIIGKKSSFAFVSLLTGLGIRKKADIDPQNKVGTSPMHWAADSGDLKIVKYLVKKGANVDLQDESGISLMHYAIANDRLEIIEYLLEQGAKLCQESKDYLYHYAAVNGYTNIRYWENKWDAL